MRKISQAHIEAIEKVLAKGDRVEIIPGKDGIALKRIKRETIKV